MSQHIACNKTVALQLFSTDNEASRASHIHFASWMAVQLLACQRLHGCLCCLTSLVHNEAIPVSQQSTLDG